ncbi:MAG: SRPBCC family protein [Bacteroidetes bacterium]|nr:SRPBCC family protein [Bacteroidota bacterium]
MDINNRAPASTRHQIVIGAPIEKVWNLLSDIDRWPSWNPTISFSKLEGPLAPGTSFRWKSKSAPIVSILQEVIPQKRISWTGKSMGTKAIHIWELEAQGNNTIVKTEESFNGLIVKLLKGMMQKTLDQSLQEWLLCLKQNAER